MIDRPEVLEAFKNVRELLQKKDGTKNFSSDALGFPVQTITKGFMFGLGKRTIIQLEDEAEFLQYVDIMTECGINAEDAVRTLCDVSVRGDGKEHIYVTEKGLSKEIAAPHTGVDAICEMLTHIVTKDQKENVKKLIDAGLKFSEIVDFCTYRGYNTTFSSKQLDILLKDKYFPAAIKEYGDGFWRLIRDSSVIKGNAYYEAIFSTEHTSAKDILKAVIEQESQIMKGEDHQKVTPNAIHDISAEAWSKLLSKDNASFSVLRDLCDYPKGSPSPYRINNIALATFVLTPTEELSEKTNPFQLWIDEVIKSKEEIIQQLEQDDEVNNQEEIQQATEELKQTERLNGLLKILIKNGQTEQFDTALEKLQKEGNAELNDKIEELKELAKTRNDSIIPQLDKLCTMPPEEYDALVGISQRKAPDGSISRIGNSSHKTLLEQVNRGDITFEAAQEKAASLVKEKEAADLAAEKASQLGTTFDAKASNGKKTNGTNTHKAGTQGRKRSLTRELSI